VKHHGLVAGAALGFLSITFAGCSDDGRELRPPSPHQTTTTATPTGAAGNESDAAPGTNTFAMRLSSPALTEGGEFPEHFGCRGEDVSPPLVWEGVPAETVEIAVVVRDADAGGFVHWVVAALDPTTGGLAEGTVPAGAVEATNDFGEPGWRGPCPPEGTHSYDLRVHALAEPSNIAAGETGSEAATAIESAPALGSAALSVQATAPN
jgi:Raf kinase inhibitor-like YbhB/YbcL family protein